MGSSSSSSARLVGVIQISIGQTGLDTPRRTFVDILRLGASFTRTAENLGVGQRCAHACENF